MQQGFTRNCDLTRHFNFQNTFWGDWEKPYQCSQSVKTFSQINNLKMHFKTHSGEKSYKCCHCDFSVIWPFYSQKLILRLHDNTPLGKTISI